ncbi:sugar transporter [Paracoccus caeni]|uniref:Sugar transporter n=1 Tax=Paracoccus caeni TaxID=657651 RepID=A0A934SHI4_9RHOB|nr:sugar transporter [Paracoccus caeni]
MTAAARPQQAEAAPAPAAGAAAAAAEPKAQPAPAAKEPAEETPPAAAPAGGAARGRPRGKGDSPALTIEQRRRQANRRAQALKAAQRPTPAPARPVRPTARPARFLRRHFGVVLGFVLVVLLPVLVSAWYLYARAADQYASHLGFSVRSESGQSSAELLGGITSMVGGTSSGATDTDILYKFIQSHDLVERVDRKLNLREIWSKAPGDPVFNYSGNQSLEDLLSEWSGKVKIYYDNGMIDLRVLAFDPKDSQAITQAIYDESTILINQLNDIAREDALRYARQELDRAVDRLKEARTAVTAFRNRHQLVDPTADVQGQVGVVSTLQAQLAEQLVALGLLQANAQPEDPRISQTQLRINVIREQIAAERQKFGSETATGEALSEVVGQYEGLSVDREFAEQSYTAALATYDSARAEAARQSRYLAAYVQPTLAQEPEFPQKSQLMFMIAGFLLILWIIGVMVFYSLRDRR